MLEKIILLKEKFNNINEIVQRANLSFTLMSIRI